LQTAVHSALTARHLRRVLPAALTLFAVLAPGANAAVRPEVVVRFKSTASDAQIARAGQAAGFGQVRRTAGGARIARLRRGVAVGEALARLHASPSVSWAGQNLLARTTAAFNDTGVARKAGLAGGWQSSQWNLVGPFGINAAAAWEAARLAGVEGGRGVKVAVLDTGAAYANRSPYRRSPELPSERVLAGYDFVSRDRFPNDANGHGTFVATSIAGAADNNYGMVGVAYASSIMPVRVLNSQGEGSSARIAEGIRWAVDHGARVLNVSIELYDPVFFRAQSITAAPEISSALRYAARKKAIVVAAAGNASQRDVPDTSQESNVIYVGGTTEHGCLGDYSNHGTGMDLVAPGGGADANLATDAHCRRGETPGRNIQQVTFRQGRPRTFVVPNNFKGTSMAAPHVTGTVALMLGARSLGRSPTPAAVARRLKQTATDLGAAGTDPFYGSGLLNAAAAVGTPPAAR
jgi:serine protease